MNWRALPWVTKPRNGALVKRLAPTVLAGLLLAALDRSGIPESTDLLLYDLVTTARPAPAAQAMPITLIGIDEQDITTYGWPIDDSLLCRAIDQLLANGATAVGLDLYRNRGVGAEQACLRQRFAAHPRLVSIFNQVEGIPAVPGTPAERQAYNDISIDRDGVLRRDLVHVQNQDAATVALPLRLYEIGTGDQQLRRTLETNGQPSAWLKPDSGGYNAEKEAGLGLQRLMVFRPPGSFKTWSLKQLLEHNVPDRQIRGQMVLIGSTAASLKDLFLVPQSRFSDSKRLMLLPGVEIHALRLAALLDRRAGRQGLALMPGEGDLLLVLCLAGVGLLLGETISPLRRSVTVVILLSIALGLALVGLLVLGAWIGTTLPVSSLLLMASAAWIRRGAASHEHQQQISRLLGQSTSPAVAQQLWEQRDELIQEGRFEGRLLPVTILISDIAGFTSVSEQVEPAALLTWLNRAMALCVPAVSQRGGIVNKFTGDGMLAVFGAPLSQGEDRDAMAAIDAAIEIAETMEVLNHQFQAEGLAPMKMRVGIHSGSVLAGSIGSNERLEYAVIGDTVNCASRLESLDKASHTGVVRILVSDSTRRLIDGRRPDLHWLSWGSHQIKGRQEPLLVSELRIGSAQAAAPANPPTPTQPDQTPGPAG